VLVREASTGDLPSLQRIARASFDPVYAFFALRGLRRSSFLLAAEDDGRLRGFLEGRLFPGAPSIGYVYFVATDPAQRRRGAARALVSECLREFERRGASRAFAAVPGHNEASMGLFTSLGFRRVPRRQLRRWYGLRGFGIEMRMVLAPHEILLARTFTDLSPASPDVPRGP